MCLHCHCIGASTTNANVFDGNIATTISVSKTSSQVAFDFGHSQYIVEQYTFQVRTILTSSLSCDCGLTDCFFFWPQLTSLPSQPISWTLLASNDSVSWRTLDTQSKQSMSSVATYQFTNYIPCSKYMWNFTMGSSTMTLAEASLEIRGNSRFSSPFLTRCNSRPNYVLWCCGYV